MEVKIKTAVLQDMMLKAVKGVGNDKAMPVTQWMGIEADGEHLCLTTTDGENILTVFDKAESITEPSAFTISAEMFSKLVAKTTTEFIKLHQEANVLKVVGNGSYTFPLSCDEDGELVVMPRVKLSGDEDLAGEIDAKELRDIYSAGKATIATTTATMVFCGFYLFDKGVVTSNGSKCTFIKQKIVEKPLLLNNSLMTLATLIGTEKAKFFTYDNKVFITGKGLAVQGVNMPELSEYPIESILDFTALEFPNTVKLNKLALTNILDRVGLFVSQYDKNGVSFNFGDSGVTVADLHGSATELLKTDTKNTPFTIELDIQSLRDMLSVNPEEIVVLDYGKPEAVRVTFGKTVQVLSSQLSEDEAQAAEQEEK